ncbi:MAG: SMI1/KNR4 family protein [Phycisphaera sp. RhM]|nr:SMI1/KNR4 family protein [Phycisphaera sp. RhM]
MENLRELAWFDPPTNVDESDIRDIESQLGIRFPEDYRHFLATSGGGSPIESDFLIAETRGPFNASVGVFFDVISDEYGISSTLESLQSRKIEGLVPIAESGGGDFVCFDYRQGTPPSLVYWHHGRRGLNDEVVFISRTFAAFLELLYEPVDEE